MTFDNERSAFGRRHARNDQTGERDGRFENSLVIIARAGERTPKEFICCVIFTSLLQTMIEAARGVVSGDRVQRSPVSRNDQKTGEILCLSPESIGRGAFKVTPNRIGKSVYMRNRKVNAAQICNLPYRRIAFCGSVKNPAAAEHLNHLPITNRRYGRLQICTTKRRPFRSQLREALSEKALLENRPNLRRVFLREKPGARTIPNSNASHIRRRNN